MAMLRFLQTKPLSALLAAQFFSAFVDNMILFITLAIIKAKLYPDYYLPLVQSAFLFSFIILAPWVGRFADKHAKSQVLIAGNLLKAAGIMMLLAGLNPALSYAVVGAGAVVYSPAKYGILPELTSGDDQLLRANSQLESYTMLAILTGSVAGGYLSDLSVTWSLIICLVLYGLSILINTLIPRKAGNPAITYRQALRSFTADTLAVSRLDQGRFSLLGTGSFWMASAVLRMIILAWLPLTLGIVSNTQMSLIFAVTGVGIIIGAAVTPRLIAVETYSRAIFYGLAMALCIFAFTFIHNLPLTLFFLLLTGCLGGIYIVPMNTCLQKVGHSTIGAGKTIAIQNFVENTFMFLGVGAYTLASKAGIGVNTAITSTGVALLALVAVMFVMLLKPNHPLAHSLTNKKEDLHDNR
ncbi:MAG TPA: lysophospholipid transporter LplT [Bacillota bacterium]|nr:lysophospholipid transporter LplT [Bacillota bacterium]